MTLWLKIFNSIRLSNRILNWFCKVDFGNSEITSESNTPVELKNSEPSGILLKSFHNIETIGC